jgi:hypothetical protein
MKNDRVVNILYRKGKYGKWNPCKINVPVHIIGIEILNFAKEDLTKQGIEFNQVIIDSVKRK